jgi:hypothetical protein
MNYGSFAWPHGRFTPITRRLMPQVSFGLHPRGGSLCRKLSLQNALKNAGPTRDILPNPSQGAPRVTLTGRHEGFVKLLSKGKLELNLPGSRRGFEPLTLGL